MRQSASVRGITILAVCALALATLAGTSTTQAVTLSVTSLNDIGPGSLRQAIVDANPGDAIAFQVNGAIVLTSALMIGQDLNIDGPGPNKLKISGNSNSRVFVIQGGIVSISGVTISDGLADGNSPIKAAESSTTAA